MPDFAQNYFDRFQSRPIRIFEKSNKNTGIIVVIPCFSEPEILDSLKSLADCEISDKSVEIITIINFPENASLDIKKYNIDIFRFLESETPKSEHRNLKFFNILCDNLPVKEAGVGLARKIGMDEALRRFAAIQKPEGIIVGFDADSRVESNYFFEIFKQFKNIPKTNGCSIYFEHPISGNKFSQEIYNNITSYELHLRFYVNALKFINFPYAFQTLGSSFAVRADIYAKQGGMNRKKAGEDFYFLHKVIPLGHFYNLNSTCVIPSPRISDRVPFGTGAAIAKMKTAGETDFQTYNFNSFKGLKHFFEQIPDLFSGKSAEISEESLNSFLKSNNFEKDLVQIKNQSPNLQTFTKRFFDWFNAFRVMKYLNFAHETNFQRQNTTEASKQLLSETDIDFNTNSPTKELLELFRKIDRNL
jgi:hypothetical protein